MKLYRKVKASERTPDVEKGCMICHKSQGPMYCWWVPEDKWWEDADEYAYGNQDIEYWLEPIEITTQEIEAIIHSNLDQMDGVIDVISASKAIIKRLKP